MTKRNEMYKCSVCGNIVDVAHASIGELVCCNKPMQLLDENSVDAATEKHVPVVEQVDGGYKVTVGSVEHPMAEDHYIEWIEVITANAVYRKYLNPGEKPEAFFKIDEEIVKVREYCNLHGLWRN